MVTEVILNVDATMYDFGGLAGPFPDVMLVDPPYSRHVHSNATTSKTADYAPGYAQNNDLGFGHLTPYLRRRIASFAASVNRWSVIFSDLESTWLWRISLQAAGATYIRSIPWVRWSMPQLSGDRPPTGAEMITVAYGKKPGRKHWNGPGNLLALEHTCLRGSGKHKTEKPLDMMLDLVSYFSDPGELVFDPCAGSGTTGVACKLLDRQFLGFELDASWAARANSRLVDPLSARDRQRHELWVERQVIASAERERMAANTAKSRAKSDAKRAAEKEARCSSAPPPVPATPTMTMTTETMAALPPPRS